MMPVTILYFDIAHAIRTHDYIIEKSGGLTGSKSIDLLESVLENIQNDLYYPSFVEKLTHLVFSVDKFHAFNDGNKRSAIGLGAYFLEINGYSYCVEHFIREMENVVVWVADNKIDKSLLYELILALIEDGLYDESLQLRLIDAINYDEL